MPTANIYPGAVFGRLTVEHRAPTRPRANAMWACLCACGTRTNVRVDHLVNGDTISCGCARREMNRTHGKRSSPEYQSWKAMIQRCHNPNAVNYAWYGGRGVEVCAEWRASFDAFYRDLGPRPGVQYSLDRIDPNGHYEPANCRWASRWVQAHNKRPRGVPMTADDDAWAFDEPGEGPAWFEKITIDTIPR